jgi:hypothetical protein
LTNWPSDQNILGGQFLGQGRVEGMFDNLFVFMGPTGTAMALFAVLGMIAGMVSVGRHTGRPAR